MNPSTRRPHTARCSLALTIASVALAGALGGQSQPTPTSSTAERNGRAAASVPADPPPPEAQPAGSVDAPSGATPGNPVPEFDPWLLFVIGGLVIVVAHRRHVRRSRTA